MRTYKRQLGALRTVTEKIALLQYSGEHIKFRRRHKIPPSGFPYDLSTKQFIGRDKWFNKLVRDRDRYLHYQLDLKKLADRFGFAENEMKTLEDYLQTGEPIISVTDDSRIKLEINKETQEIKAWVRVDGLSLSQIIELVEELKEEKPTLIKSDYKQMGKPSNLLWHKRIYELWKARKSTKEIIQLITRASYKAPEEYYNQVKIPSEENIRQIVSRYSKDMRKKLANRDKLKSKM